MSLHESNLDASEEAPYDDGDGTLSWARTSSEYAPSRSTSTTLGRLGGSLVHKHREAETADTMDEDSDLAGIARGVPEQFPLETLHIQMPV